MTAENISGKNYIEIVTKPGEKLLHFFFSHDENSLFFSFANGGFQFPLFALRGLFIEFPFFDLGLNPCIHTFSLESLQGGLYRFSVF